MDQLKEILGRMTTARKQAGLSQSQAARLLGLGGASSLSPIETGEVPLTLERFLKMCELYDISQEWALSGVNPDFDPQPLIEAFGGMTDQAERVIELAASLRRNKQT